MHPLCFVPSNTGWYMYIPQNTWTGWSWATKEASTIHTAQAVCMVSLDFPCDSAPFRILNLRPILSEGKKGIGRSSKTRGDSIINASYLLHKSLGLLVVEFKILARPWSS